MNKYDYSLDPSSCILFVEDDAIMIFILKAQMRRVLKKEFNKIIIKENGRTALDFLNSIDLTAHSLPKLIILDINMPVMNGWEFLEHKHNDDILAQIPVLILTSSVNKEDVEKAQQYSSVIDFKSKPLSGEDLKQIVDSYSEFSD